MKICKWPEIKYSFSPIDCSVRINNDPVGLIVIFSHTFLESNSINFKTFAFLVVYWPFWTSLYNTTQTSIRFNNCFNRASTTLNTVFKMLHLKCLSISCDTLNLYRSALSCFLGHDILKKNITALLVLNVEFTFYLWECVLSQIIDVDSYPWPPFTLLCNSNLGSRGSNSSLINFRAWWLYCIYKAS